MADDYVNKQLPTWMRSVELDTNSTRLVAIEGAATDLASKLSRRKILDMILLAHGQVRGDTFDYLRDAIRNHDQTFGALPDDLESTIAAGAVIAKLLSRKSKSASVSAQGVLSAKWLGLQPTIAELPKLAVVTSRQRSEALRQRRHLPREPVDSDFFSDVLAEGTEAEPDDGIGHEDLQLLVEAATEMAIKLQSRQYTYAAALATRLDAADEELELLWWAYSEYSDLAGQKWVDLAPETAALLCGIEMGEKLTFEIELPSTATLLGRLLGPDIHATVTLATAVEGATSFLEPVELPTGHPLLPILSSVSEHRTLHGDPAWKGSVGRWRISADHATDKLAFACQAVRERSLMGNVSNG